MASWNSGFVSLLCCSRTRLPVWWKAWMNSCSYGISIVLLLTDLGSVIVSVVPYSCMLCRMCCA
jgi:uncharacterized membrane protein YhhN